MAATQSDDQFTIERFLEMYAKSTAAGLLPVEMKMALDQAIERRDLATLQKLYDVLAREESTEKNIARDFTEAKGRIMDRFMITATDIRKRYADAPMKEQIAATASAEKAEAEKLLKKIQ